VDALVMKNFHPWKESFVLAFNMLMSSMFDLRAGLRKAERFNHVVKNL